MSNRFIFLDGAEGVIWKVERRLHACFYKRHPNKNIECEVGYQFATSNCIRYNCQLMNKKIHSPSPSAASSHSARTASPAPSATSVHSDDEDGEFVVVGGSVRRDRREWEQRRSEVHKDLRVMEYCLVLASVMMKELNTPEIIARNCYFGRYGNVEKVIISSKHTSYSAKNQHVQAFITYRSELDTAFAIAALRDLQHHRHCQLKVHYGTSRYCPQFIVGKDCQHPNCYFNHRLRENHEHKDKLPATVEGQYDRAYDIIADNLEYFVEKEYQEFKNREKMHKEVPCLCGKGKENVTFPSCKEVLQRLIADGCLAQTHYDAAKAKIKSNHQAQRQRCTSLQVQNKENKAVQGKPENSSPTRKQQQTASVSLQLSPLSLPHTNEAAFPALPIESPSKLTTSRQEHSQLSMPKRIGKRVPETLEEYIERNIINENDPPSAGKLRPLLTERIRAEKPFLGEKVGEVLGYSRCEMQGLNPETDACQYLIGKIMKKTFTGCSVSRFQFAGWVDRKTQDTEARKLRDIIGKKLMN